MSYDLELVGENGMVVQFDTPHAIRGGTYAMGGTTKAAFNITYNYAPHYYRTMGEKGIRTIYGMTGRESLPILDAAIGALGTDEHPDYWEPTEGNARVALLNLRLLASMAPDAKWTGD